MANDFIFTSPGVKFRERNLTFVTESTSITTLGLVGETVKGPAFEPVLVSDKSDFDLKFGGMTSEKYENGEFRYQTAYVGKTYLEESNQLYVTRVLGLDGYDAGTAWGVKTKGGVDLTTTGVTSTTTTGETFSNFVYRGVTLSSNGASGSTFGGFEIDGVNYVGNRYSFTVTSINPLDGVGTLDETVEVISGATLSAYDDMVVMVLRSRATITDNIDLPSTTSFNADSITISSNNTIINTGDPLGTFVITANNSVDSSSETYTVSLNPNSRDYIVNVLGDSPRNKNTKLYVDKIYPELIKKLDADENIFGIQNDLVDADSNIFTDYTQQYQTPETPYIVSELRGNDVSRLFKLVSISDGASANKEIKISLQNINPITKEFDVVIRDFNDTDKNIVLLESFQRCTMVESSNNFIGKRIGTTNGDYSLNSSYVMVELDQNAPQDAYPAGFEGYLQNNWAISATTSANSGVAPKIHFKQSYSSTDKVNRTYLGVSERAYDGAGLVGDGIASDFFTYKRQEDASSLVKSKGFHLDSGATGTYFDGETSIGQFEVGAGELRDSADIADGSIYGERNSAKFTLVPSGGFDGWNGHRGSRTNTDLYKVGNVYDSVSTPSETKTDYVAWSTAFRTFANPEEVTINLFATPALNWSDNLGLVEEVIDIMENERTDTLYIVDSPDINVVGTFNKRDDVIAAEDIVDLLVTTEIDSNYATTYFPHIQVNNSDTSMNMYLPATGEVVKAMAFTDTVAFPWFAPAGLQRGATDSRKAKYKLSQGAKDILYSGNINPMVEYTDTGVAIMGQKTLQEADSALNKINVRRLLLRLKVLISNIAVRLLFEQADETTVDQFLDKANPILESIKRERGLETFNIKMELTPESRDRNELIGEIELVPTKSLENIGISFTISPSGASFQNI